MSDELFPSGVPSTTQTGTSHRWIHLTIYNMLRSCSYSDRPFEGNYFFAKASHYIPSSGKLMKTEIEIEDHKQRGTCLTACLLPASSSAFGIPFASKSPRRSSTRWQRHLPYLVRASSMTLSGNNLLRLDHLALLGHTSLALVLILDRGPSRCLLDRLPLNTNPRRLRNSHHRCRAGPLRFGPTTVRTEVQVSMLDKGVS